MKEVSAVMDTGVLVVRFVHVAAMGVLLGGACLVAYLLLATPSRELLSTARAYERLFWAAIGVLVATGIGNVAAFGRTLPDLQSTWGLTFVLKLCAVLVLVSFSLVRTLVVAQLGTPGAALSRRGHTILAASYVVTALGAATILGLAVRLAHGSA